MIKCLKWNNYKAIGNLELDFSKDDGTLYNTVILAGENGTGKTTILDTLATYLNRQSVEPFEFIEYMIDGVDYHIVPDDTNAQNGFHIRSTGNGVNNELVQSGERIRSKIVDIDAKDLRHYGFSYSKARSGFNTERVKSVTTQQLDVDKYEPDAHEDFTRVKQLLIDIEAQDSQEWKMLSEEGMASNENYQKFKSHSKMHRFEVAFNAFFESIKYYGINDTDPLEKSIMFKKHGNLISVDQLSTGEKQIVFRGAHLLRNTNNIAGGIVLIDEPELSMHPMWQRRILDYYRGLYTEGGNQSVQMIIATHSEYVIRSALKDRENVLVIVLSDDNGVIKGRRITAPNALPTITAAETNYLAFGVPSIDYHIELYGYLQSKINKSSVRDCDYYIAHHQAYDVVKHGKSDQYKQYTYLTLPTYIRNAIDHPDSQRQYNENELITSIELLRALCK